MDDPLQALRQQLREAAPPPLCVALFAPYAAVGGSDSDWPELVCLFALEDAHGHRLSRHARQPELPSPAVLEMMDEGMYQHVMARHGEQAPPPPAALAGLLGEQDANAFVAAAGQFLEHSEALCWPARFTWDGEAGPVAGITPDSTEQQFALRVLRFR